MSYAELAREGKAKAINEMRAILDAATSEHLDLTKAEVARVEVLDAEAERYDRDATRARDAEKYAAQAAEFRGIPPVTETHDEPSGLRSLSDINAERGFAAGDFQMRALSTSANVNAPTHFMNEWAVYERDGAPMLNPDIVTIHNVDAGQAYIFPKLTADAAAAICR